MSVFEGTTSVRTAEPPTPRLSIRVTRAPMRAATVAASYPPGPPPMMATWAPERTDEAFSVCREDTILTKLDVGESEFVEGTGCDDGIVSAFQI